MFQAELHSAKLVLMYEGLVHDIRETLNRGRKSIYVVDCRLLAGSTCQKLEVNESLSSLNCRSHRCLTIPSATLERSRRRRGDTNVENNCGNVGPEC